MSTDYLDLDIIIARQGEAYTLLLDSPAGDKGVALQLPLAQLQVEAQGLAELSGWDDPAAEDIAERWGQSLYEVIFGGAQRLMGAIRTLARERGRGVRLRVRSDDLAIQSLPWEFLHDGKEFLALDRNTPIVRYLHVEQSRPSLLATHLPLRLLVVLALPDELSPLEGEQEWQRLYQALEPLVEEGLLEVQWLSRATRESLNNAFQEEPPYDLLHFVGHGFFEPTSGQSGIFLEDDLGQADRVAATVLARWVRNARLRMVFLNACDTARSSPATNRITGVAQRLVVAGVGAVMAHQFPVEDRSGIKFAKNFYQALANGCSLEAAASIARAIVSDFIAWGTPVLFLRADDGRLFDKEALTDKEKAALRQAGLWRCVNDALAMQKWDALLSRLDQLSEAFPNDLHAQAERRKYREADRLIQKAQQLLEQGSATESYAQLNQIKRRLGKVNYRDIEGRIREAERHKEAAAPASTLLEQSRLSSEAQEQARQILSALHDGRLVPFLGSDANLCGREGQPWQFQAPFAPTTRELAEHLATRFPYPKEYSRSLARVSQYMTWMSSEIKLYEELDAVYKGPQQPSPLHRLLAQVAAMPLIEQGMGPPPHLILISANYDEVLEESLRASGIAFHLLTYEPEQAGGGKFRHTPPGGDPALDGETVIAPNKYDLAADGIPVVIKLNGGLVTAVRHRLLLTEDQFIEYAPREEIQNLLPHSIKAQLVNSHFLFLGYTLRDWPLRLLLNRIGKRYIHSWAVVDPSDSGLIPWESVSPSIRKIGASLDDFVAELAERLSMVEEGDV